MQNFNKRTNVIKVHLKRMSLNLDYRHMSDIASSYHLQKTILYNMHTYEVKGQSFVKYQHLLSCEKIPVTICLTI